MLRNFNALGQPREGQAYRLPASANTDPKTTHVAVQKEKGFKYFCRFDPTDKSPHQGVPDDEVHGTYWITGSKLYGSCYHGCSLWQGGFNFIPLAEWGEA